MLDFEISLNHGFSLNISRFLAIPENLAFLMGFDVELLGIKGAERFLTETWLFRE